MTIDWWTLGLQTVNVVVLVWLLARFLFRPISRIIDERQAAAHAALDDAAAARAEARAVRDAAQAEADAIAAQRADLVAKAREAAEQEKQRLLDEGRAAAEKARAEGEADLQRIRQAQAHALSEQAAVLATDIAGRLVDRLPADTRIAGFIDGLVDAVAALPAPTLAGIGSEGAVTLRAARALTAEERDRLRARLGDVIGQVPELEIEVDPDLIAGLDLVAPHAVVRNSLRADLERIRAELASDD